MPQLRHHSRGATSDTDEARIRNTRTPASCLGQCRCRSGLRCVDVATALIQHACRHSLECAVVSLDHALHERLVTEDELTRRVAAATGWTGAERARRAVALADGRSESPGESRLRVLCHLMGFPVTPQVQVRCTHRTYRVDLLLDAAAVILEFDGAGKYTDGDRRVLWKEKEREDALRAQGYEVIRVTWAELHDLATLRGKVAAAVDRPRRRSGGSASRR